MDGGKRIFRKVIKDMKSEGTMSAQKEKTREEFKGKPGKNIKSCRGELS